MNNHYLIKVYFVIILFFSFITFRSCSYLDGKHTIFGRVVGGTETLNAIEKIETDESSRPIASFQFPV